MIEKCSNFQRFLTPVNTEGQVCLAQGVSIDCAGFSDHCKYPQSFKSIKGIPNSEIIFPNNIPSLEELRARVERQWQD